MVSAWVFSLLFAGAALAQGSPQPPALDKTVIDQVNSQNLGWVAGRNSKFDAMTLKQAIGLLGTLTSPADSASTSNAGDDSYDAGKVPLEFDCRKNFSTCIHPVRDQGSCGGCWAFAATEVLSDRHCIASKGATNVILSPEDLISCDITKYTLGCNGGVPEYAWKYLETTGISTEGCIPYIGNKTEACPSSCADSSPFRKYKVKIGSTRHLSGASSTGAVQQDMYQNGPVQAAMLVYQDFFHYKSGIYRHTNGTLLGKHSVKLVGYGVDHTYGAYWIVANSWGPDWGDNGFFRIARGRSESGIEDSMVYGQALVELEAIV